VKDRMAKKFGWLWMQEVWYNLSCNEEWKGHVKEVKFLRSLWKDYIKEKINNVFVLVPTP
jgi:hypothetical protein